MPEKRIRPAHETVAELRSADVPPVSPVPSQVSSPVSSSGSPSGSSSGSLAPDTGVRHRLHQHADPRRAPSLDELIDAFQEPGRPDYYDVRDLFQREHGQIRESYFARNFHAGAVMVKPRGWVARLSRTRKIKLRYDGLQAAAVQPGFEAAIWRARAMDRESGLILGGRSRKVLVEMLFAIMVYLLGVLDAMAPTDRADVPHTSDQQRRARVEAALTQARAELARLERFATSAARKA